MNPSGSDVRGKFMNKTIKLTIAALVAVTATTMGIAAPADAKAPDFAERSLECC
jgi:hypothetical protein